MSSNSSAGAKVFVAVVVILFVVLLLALAWKMWHMRSSMPSMPMAAAEAPAMALPAATVSAGPSSAKLEVKAMSAGSPMEYYGQMGGNMPPQMQPHYHWDEHPWAAAAAAHGGAPYMVPPPPQPAVAGGPKPPASSSGEGAFVHVPYGMPPPPLPPAAYAGAYDADFGGYSNHMHHYEHAPN